jgi:hypothetical protein
MTHDPWQTVSPDEEPSQAALAGVDLVPKQGGYSLQDILSLHDTALQVGPGADAGTVGLPTVGKVAGPLPAPAFSVEMTLAPLVPDEPAVAYNPPPPPPAPPAPPEPVAPAPQAAAAPMPAMNPFAAFSMPVKPETDTGKPAKRGGLPVIDPSEFAAAPVDRIEASPAPAAAAEPDVIAPERPSEVQLHALQQSLAALDELEAQLSMLTPEPVAEPEPGDWVDALATVTPSPAPVPSPAEPSAKALIGPTTADDVVDDDDDESLPFSPAPIERLEPAVQFPFPGMGTYAEEPVVATTDVMPPPLPAMPPPPAAATGAVAGDPPFFFHLDGEPVDLATDMGIATCEEAARSAIADAGRAVQTMLEGQQRQRRMQELMGRVHAGGLNIDEVIGLGQELQHLRDEIGGSTVDRRAISQLVARLEQQRALMGRLIDLLWRT